MAQQNILNTALISEIKNLSVSERILIVADIWDSIALSSDQLSVTSHQKEELDKRYIAYKKKSRERHILAGRQNKIRI